MACGDFKNLPRITAGDKGLSDKAFDIAKNPNYDRYQRGLAPLVYNFFLKKSALLTDKSAFSGGNKNKNMPDQQLAEEWHKPIIQKFDKLKAHLSFIDNIWRADLADIQLISKFNKEIRFYYVLLIFV